MAKPLLHRPDCCTFCLRCPDCGATSPPWPRSSRMGTAARRWGEVHEAECRARRLST